MSPNGNEITNEVDFPTYKTDFENQLDKFSNLIDTDFGVQHKSITNQELFNSLFHENNKLQLDMTISSSLSAKYTRFVKPFQHEFQVPAEKYPIEDSWVSGNIEQPLDKVYVS